MLDPRIGGSPLGNKTFPFAIAATNTDIIATYVLAMNGFSKDYRISRNIGKNYSYLVVYSEMLLASF